MSHTTTLKTVSLNNVTALQEAVEFLKSQGVKCDLKQDIKPRMYYQDQYAKCDYVLQLHNSPYDVGFAKQKDGTYLPVFDSWNGHIQKEIGMPSTCPVPKTEEERAAAVVSRLLDCYAVHAAKTTLEESGTYYAYEVGYDKTDGSYTLEATETYG